MKLKKLLSKHMFGGFNAFALLLVMQTANSACVWVMNQPEFPKEASKYKKDLK